jgi:hypothetical protein
MAMQATHLAARAVLAIALVGLALAAYTGVTTMARTLVTATNTTKALTAGSTAAQPTATSTVAIAPHAHAQPVQPNGTPANGWAIVGTPSTAKKAVAGVGPCPPPTAVGYLALRAMGAKGCTWAAAQAAVGTAATVKQHPLLPLLTWLAKHRGYSFAYSNGVLTCTNNPVV